MVKKSSASTTRKAPRKLADQPVQSRNRLLKDFTEDALRSYLRNLNGHRPADMYRFVLGEIEPPLFQAIMDYAEGNQTLAAEILGLNRATLRKKLKQYDLRG